MSQTPPSPEAVIPIIEEEATIDRTLVETGAVRVRVHTDSRTELIDEPVTTRGVTVERIPRDTFVEERREPWYEGDVTVVPVYQEVIVKRILLVEELRLTPTLSVRHETKSLELTSETAVFERQSPDGTWQEVPPPELPSPRAQ